MLCKVRFGHFWVQFMVKLILMLLIVVISFWRMRKGDDWVPLIQYKNLCREYSIHTIPKNQKKQLHLHLNPSWAKRAPISSHLCQCFFQCDILCLFQVGTLHIRSFDVPPAMSWCPPPRTRRWQKSPKFILKTQRLDVSEQTMAFLKEKVLLLLHNTLQILKKNRYSATKCFEVSQLYNYYV